MALKEIGHVGVKKSIVTVQRYLQIGSHIIQDYEHPPDLEFGLEQHMVSHEYIGGNRAVQTLGAFGKDVTWSGDFLGDGNAALRAQLDIPSSVETTSVSNRIKVFSGMAATGAEQLLKWLDERYDVVVKEFLWKYHTQFRAEYTITVHVVRDVSGRYSQVQPTSVDTQATALGAQAVSYSTLVSAVDPSVSAANLQKAVATSVQSLPTITPIAQTVGSAGTFLAGAGAALTQARAYLATLSSVFPNTHVLNANQLVSTLTLLVNGVERGQAPNVIQVVGGSWPKLAAKHYGDSSLWLLLAKANGASGMYLPSKVLTTVVLPPLQPTTKSVA